MSGFTFPPLISATDHHKDTFVMDELEPIVEAPERQVFKLINPQINYEKFEAAVLDRLISNRRYLCPDKRYLIKLRRKQSMKARRK